MGFRRAVIVIVRRRIRVILRARVCSRKIWTRRLPCSSLHQRVCGVQCTFSAAVHFSVIYYFPVLFFSPFRRIERIAGARMLRRAFFSPRIRFLLSSQEIKRRIGRANAAFIKKKKKNKENFDIEKN